MVLNCKIVILKKVNNQTIKVNEIGTKTAHGIQNWTTYAPPNIFRAKPYIFDNHRDDFCNFVKEEYTFVFTYL